jgi:hypothetical protein
VKGFCAGAVTEEQVTTMPVGNPRRCFVSASDRTHADGDA